MISKTGSKYKVKNCGKPAFRYLMNVKASPIEYGIVEIEVEAEPLPSTPECIKTDPEKELLEALSAVIRDDFKHCSVEVTGIEKID